MKGLLTSPRVHPPPPVPAQRAALASQLLMPTEAPTAPTEAPTAPTEAPTGANSDQCQQQSNK